MADEQNTYPNAQAAVDALRPGWKVVGQRPYYVTVPNEGAAANEPQTISKQMGTIYSVMGPDGSPDEITLGSSDKTVVWNTEPGAPLPKALVVIKGPSKELPAGGQASDPSKWTPIYRVPGDANSGLVAQWDPVNKQYHPVAAAPGAQPTGKYDPVYRDPNKPESGVIALVDTGDKSFHPVAGEPNAKPSGQYENVLDPRDPSGKRIIGMVDIGSKTFHPLAQDPTTQKQIVTTPEKLFVFNADGSLASTIDIDRTQPAQAVVIGNQAYSFDPKTGTFTKGPATEEPATLSVNTTAKELIWYDKNGKEVSRQTNPNYQPAAAPVPAVSANAPMVPIPDPDKPGEIKWVPNEGRVTIGQATQNLIKDLTGQTVDPNNPMTIDEAKTVIDTAIARMNAEAQQAATATSAATGALGAISQGAATGAGILNQRVQAAQNMVQSGLGLVGQRRGPLPAMPGIGAELVGGAQAWATELGGGQGVYDTAARLVKAADPQGGSPLGAQAAAALTQILTRYQQDTGQKHPAVVATETARANAGAQQFVPPAAVAPAVFQAQYDPRLNPAAPQQTAGTVLPVGVAGTVAPGDPRFLGFTAPPMQGSREALNLVSALGGM